MAHAIAKELDVSPWDALLGEVRRSAGEVAWLDSKVATALDDDDLRPGGSHHDWVKMRERARSWLGRVSKMAVDAGVAAMLVQREQVAGEQLAAVLNRTLVVMREAGMSEQLEAVARSAFRTELLTLAGDVAEGSTGPQLDDRREIEGR